MIKYYCDKCGKEISIDTLATRIYVGDIYSDKNSYNKHLYLCSKCESKLKKLIRRIARKYGAR